MILKTIFGALVITTRGNPSEGSGRRHADARLHVRARCRRVHVRPEAGLRRGRSSNLPLRRCHLADVRLRRLPHPSDPISGTQTYRTRAITLIQRFGSAANFNIHIDGLVLDGVFRLAEGRPELHTVRTPTIEQLQTLLTRLIERLMAIS